MLLRNLFETGLVNADVVGLLSMCYDAFRNFYCLQYCFAL